MNSKDGVQLGFDFGIECIQLGDRIQQVVIDDLHINLDFIQIPLLADGNQIVRANAVNTQQHFLNLRREDIDAADDEHIIGTAFNLGHARSGTATGAGGVVEVGNILGAVTDQRQCLLGDGGDNQFAAENRRI